MTPETGKKPSLFSRMSRTSLAWLVGVGVVVVLVLAVVVALWATAQPTYFARYSTYQHSISTLGGSAHKGMACDQCHAGASGAGYRIALVGDFYAGMFGKPDTPPFFKLATPTRQECLKCHAYDWSMRATKTARVPHPAHLRVIDERRNCVDCHRWVGHEEKIQVEHQKMPFSVVCASFGCHVGWKQPNQCGNCHHQLQQSLDTWKTDHPKVVLANSANGCLEKCHKPEQCRLCHTTGKTPVFPGVINASTVSNIEKAHIKPTWISQHGAFAMADQRKCLTCHVTLQECQDCHTHKPAFHGTDNTAWIGTGHEAFAKANPKRCFACHKPAQCNTCHQSFGAKIAPFPENASPYATPAATSTPSQNATQ